jgi:hypothetical protein
MNAARHKHAHSLPLAALRVLTARWPMGHQPETTDLLADQDSNFQRVDGCSRIRHSRWKR